MRYHWQWGRRRFEIELATEVASARPSLVLLVIDRIVDAWHRGHR